MAFVNSSVFLQIPVTLECFGGNDYCVEKKKEKKTVVRTFTQLQECCWICVCVRVVRLKDAISVHTF